MERRTRLQKYSVPDSTRNARIFTDDSVLSSLGGARATSLRCRLRCKPDMLDETTKRCKWTHADKNLYAMRTRAQRLVTMVRPIAMMPHSATSGRNVVCSPDGATTNAWQSPIEATTHPMHGFEHGSDTNGDGGGKTYRRSRSATPPVQPRQMSSGSITPTPSRR